MTRWTKQAPPRLQPNQSTVPLFDSRSPYSDIIAMLTTLISLLVVGLVLVIIFYVAGMFLPGNILQIVGIILGLVFLLYALNAFRLLPAL